jgi:hypothetical protein
VHSCRILANGAIKWRISTRTGTGGFAGFSGIGRNIQKGKSAKKRLIFARVF